MAGILSVNSNPLKIIVKYAKKDFKNELIKSDSYLAVQNSIVMILKKEKNSELNEILFNTEMDIQYSELYNFDTFMSIRFAFYAIVLAIFSIILTSKELLDKFAIKALDSSNNMLGYVSKEWACVYADKIDMRMTFELKVKIVDTKCLTISVKRTNFDEDILYDFLKPLNKI